MKRQILIVKKETPKPNEEGVIMNDEGIDNYVDRNGYHFTTKLADYVSENFLSHDGHVWKSGDLEMTNIPDKFTLGDLIVYSNKLYKDLIVMGIPKDIECVKYSMRLLSYYPPETSFTDFLNYYKWKDLKINWSDF